MFVDTELLKKINVYKNRTIGNPNRCFYCGAEGYTNADHFYPKCLGGRFKVRSCVSCNSEKKNLTPRKWIAYLRDQIEEDLNKREKYQRMLIASESLWKKTIQYHLMNQ